MTKLSGFLGCLLFAAQGIAAQTASTQPQIDSKWLTVDSSSKTATFQLISGLTQLSSGLNFNGFNDGKLTLTVPTGWTVVIRFKNQDPNLPHSAEVVDSAKPIPAGPVDPPAFAHAMSTKLMTGLAPGDSGTFKFVANKAGSYMILCAVPGHGLAGMWLRLNVSPAEKRPTVTTT
jgi:sulfocyanin